MTIKGVYMLHRHCRMVIGQILLSHQKQAQNGVFWELRGLYVKFLFSNPKKAHSCAKTRILRENRFLEEPKKEAA